MNRSSNGIRKSATLTIVSVQFRDFRRVSSFRRISMEIPNLGFPYLAQLSFACCVTPLSRKILKLSNPSCWSCWSGSMWSFRLKFIEPSFNLLLTQLVGAGKRKPMRFMRYGSNSENPLFSRTSSLPHTTQSSRKSLQPLELNWLTSAVPLSIVSRIASRTNPSPSPGLQVPD